MTDLDLLRQLGELLRRPLQEVSEEQFERHGQIADSEQGNAAQARLTRDAYCLAQDGTVSGLFLQPVNSQILHDSSWEQLRNLKYLFLSNVKLPSYSFLSELTGLTTLDLSHSNIADYSFLSELTGLTTLNLSHSNIADYSFLSELTGLTTLNLSHSSIADCSFLSELTGLTTLDLSFNVRIKDHSFLTTLTGLTSLNLSWNRISNYSFLSELTELASLDLSVYTIIDCSFLNNLTRLTSLNLANNAISDYSFLNNLTRLTSLDLTDNTISDYSFLNNLTRLTSLNLASSTIEDYSLLNNLTRLTSLNLSFNTIRDYSFLNNLTRLTSLNLWGNGIEDCSFLRDFTGLTSLNLRKNGISDCSFLKNFTGLTSLNLRENRISDCSFLRNLTGLTSLNIAENCISDCSFLRNLTGLTSLSLSYNRISDCSFLRNLTGLTSLLLRRNGISDCSFLRNLTGLTSLDLCHNNIKKIPRWLFEGRIAVDVSSNASDGYIHSLADNPIEEPPLEIVRKGSAYILNYYTQLVDQGQGHIYEAKMLIVGEGEAGKTTLAQKVLTPNCPLPHFDDRTQGISIKTHTFPCIDKDNPERQRDFHLNIWDFGGQEIYHYTHRFFLSKRSLYVLVADNRKDDTDFNYWLHIIEPFADSSPLIIVLNEKGDIQRSINRAELRSRYPDSIKEILPVNFKTHEESDKPKANERLKSINNLIGHIQNCAQNLSHIGEPIPARWVDVRQAIEADSRNYIYREQFDDLCQAQDITASADIDTLLGYFHDLGILLHFADSPFLRDRVILKPTWATNAVYRIFDDDRIKAKAGRFTRQDCADIWQEAQYRHMHDVLIELMKNFRLIYESTADNTTSTPSSQLVAPQLLPQNTPDYPWNDAQNSHMQFRYDGFMPKGIFWQFAVTLYRYIPDQAWVWRNGIIIQRDNTQAEIIENLQQRRITLRFRGPSIPEFRAIIVDQLDGISQSYHQLQYEKMIPCQCSECADSNQPEFFDYAIVKKRQEKGKKDTIECRRSEEDVNLSLLLRGYEIQAILQTLPDKQNGDPMPLISVSNPSSSPDCAPLKRKLLILAANPKSSTRLRLDEEVRDISEGLKRARHRDDFEIAQRWAVRTRDFQRAMLEETPQIVHFSGHGEGEAGLYFEDEVGNQKMVTGTALASLFKLFAQKTQIECVILNGCYSQIQAAAIVGHVPYVIGMQQAVGDQAAIEFAVGFYDALGNGESVEFAFKSGKVAMELSSTGYAEIPLLMTGQRINIEP